MSSYEYLLRKEGDMLFKLVEFWNIILSWYWLSLFEGVRFFTLTLRSQRLSPIKNIAVPLDKIWHNNKIGSSLQPWKIKIPPHSNPTEEKKRS